MKTLSLDSLVLVHGGVDLGPAKRMLSRGAQWGVDGAVACGVGGAAIGGGAGAFGGGGRRGHRRRDRRGGVRRRRCRGGRHERRDRRAAPTLAVDHLSSSRVICPHEQWE